LFESSLEHATENLTNARRPTDTTTSLFAKRNVVLLIAFIVRGTCRAFPSCRKRCPAFADEKNLGGCALEGDRRGTDEDRAAALM